MPAWIHSEQPSKNEQISAGSCAPMPHQKQTTDSHVQAWSRRNWCTFYSDMAARSFFASGSMKSEVVPISNIWRKFPHCSPFHPFTVAASLTIGRESSGLCSDPALSRGVYDVHGWKVVHHCQSLDIASTPIRPLNNKAFHITQLCYLHILLILKPITLLIFKSRRGYLFCCTRTYLNFGPG